jgi:hypothetical protein
MPHGSLVAIAAGGAALVVAVVIGAVVAARSCSSDAPPPPARASGNANAAVGEEGMRAPGTAELRKLGCEQALVVDMARLLGDASRIREGEPGIMVTCDVPAALYDAPTCDRAAAAYFGAIGGTADQAVGVRVLRAGLASPVCSRLYAPNGADLGVFPRIP